MLKKLLITGFEPFGGESINPSWEAVKRLPDKIDGCELEKLLLPVVFGKATRLALERAIDVDADAILVIGQAGGRRAVTPERIGINLRNGSDGENLPYRDAPIVEGAPAAYFSTLPVREIVEAIVAEGIPSTVSYSAGTYVCNDTLYGLLHAAAGLTRPIAVGFIHLPYLPEQAKNGAFSLELDDMVRALTIAVTQIQKQP